jgi:hypothetical protein
LILMVFCNLVLIDGTLIAMGREKHTSMVMKESYCVARKVEPEVSYELRIIEIYRVGLDEWFQ